MTDYYLANWDSEGAADARRDDLEVDMVQDSCPQGVLLLDLDEATVARLLDEALKCEVLDFHESLDRPSGTWKYEDAGNGNHRWLWTEEGEEKPYLCVTAWKVKPL